MAKHETIEMPKVGIFADISNADYHGGPGISKSGLDIIRRSPLHFKASRDAEKRVPTAAQREGTIIHDLVLEPETFWDRYAKPFDPCWAPTAIVTTDDIKEKLKALGLKVSGNKPELKARLLEADPDARFLDDIKAEYEAQVGDKELITQDEFNKAQAIAAAVMAHPVAGKLFAKGSGIAELSCYWTDEKTGVLCRCRPDFWRHDGLVVDLKTTVDASPEGFSKSIEAWRYYVQDPFYRDGMTASIAQSGSDRKPPKAFVFVAVEKTAADGKSYAVGVYHLDSDSVEVGRREYRENLDTYAACVGADQWPGYGDKIQPIGLPEWRLRREFGEE